MKKLLLSAAAVAAFSGVAAIPASASDYGMGSDYGKQVYGAKDHEKDSRNKLDAYYNQTVKYEAYYYVNYYASTTSHVKQANANHEQDRYNYGKNAHAKNYFNGGY